MPRGQLARLPVSEGRRAERRIVNLAAGLRERGATVCDCDIVNLSTDGFMATCDMKVEPGMVVWLKLPGVELQKAQTVWVEGDKAGFSFTTPIHRIVLDQLTQAERKPIPKGHFGPQMGRR